MQSPSNQRSTAHRQGAQRQNCEPQQLLPFRDALCPNAPRLCCRAFAASSASCGQHMLLVVVLLQILGSLWYCWRFCSSCATAVGRFQPRGRHLQQEGGNKGAAGAQHELKACAAFNR